MILPAMKKYETKLTQAKDNFQHIADEVSVIWSQFSAIWHEVKEIFTKVIHDDISPISLQEWWLEKSTSQIPTILLIPENTTVESTITSDPVVWIHSSQDTIFNPNKV